MEQVLRDALKSILKEDGRPDPKTSFYHKFKEEVAEHDEDFYQKYDGDLNTTLVFVSSSLAPEPTWLMRQIDRSVFGHRLCVHHRYPIRTLAGLRTIEQRALRASAQCHRWQYTSWPGNLPTTLDRPGSRYPSGSSHTLCDSLYHIVCRFPGDAREAVAQSIQADRRPRTHRG